MKYIAGKIEDLKTDLIKLAVSLLVCLLAGLLGSIFTAPAIPVWYQALEKPFFTPPAWLFAPVWTLLFIMMGVSLYLAWLKSRKDQVRTTLGIFSVQLVLNILWSAAFFGLRSPLAGLIDITLLWISILLTIWVFSKISRTAGLLLVPYIVWVSFAAALNFAIWWLNH